MSTLTTPKERLTGAEVNAAREIRIELVRTLIEQKYIPGEFDLYACLLEGRKLLGSPLMRSQYLYDCAGDIIADRKRRYRQAVPRKPEDDVQPRRAVAVQLTADQRALVRTIAGNYVPWVYPMEACVAEFQKQTGIIVPVSTFRSIAQDIIDDRSQLHQKRRPRPKLPEPPPLPAPAPAPRPVSSVPTLPPARPLGQFGDGTSIVSLLKHLPREIRKAADEDVVIEQKRDKGHGDQNNRGPNGGLNYDLVARWFDTLDAHDIACGYTYPWPGDPEQRRYDYSLEVSPAYIESRTRVLRQLRGEAMIRRLPPTGASRFLLATVLGLTHDQDRGDVTAD